LGAVLYRCVTGEDAFQGKSLTEVLFAICTGEVPRATSVNPRLPNELDVFFEKAFARNPGYRFQNAKEMGAAFTEIALRYSDSHQESDLGGALLPHLGSPYELRSTTGTVVVTESSFGLRLRNALKSRAAIAATSLAIGAIGTLVLRQRPATNQMSRPLEAAGVAEREGRQRQVESASAKTLTSTLRLESASSSSGPSVVSTTAIPAKGVTQTHRKPLATTNATTHEVDPIFGLPVEAK
jgi:hypothetical protein